MSNLERAKVDEGALWHTMHVTNFSGQDNLVTE